MHLVLWISCSLFLPSYVSTVICVSYKFPSAPFFGLSTCIHQSVTTENYIPNADLIKPTTLHMTSSKSNHMLCIHQPPRQFTVSSNSIFTFYGGYVVLFFVPGVTIVLLLNLCKVRFRYTNVVHPSEKVNMYVTTPTTCLGLLYFHLTFAS